MGDSTTMESLVKSEAEGTIATEDLSLGVTLVLLIFTRVAPSFSVSEFSVPSLPSRPRSATDATTTAAFSSALWT